MNEMKAVNRVRADIAMCTYPNDGQLPKLDTSNLSREDLAQLYQEAIEHAGHAVEVALTADLHFEWFDIETEEER